MAGLAAEAGVSRQLVYDHFADVATLYGAFVEDRLARYRVDSPHAPDVDRSSAVRQMFQHLVAVPPADRRIIRLLVADTGITELDAVRRRFRAAELKRWRQTFGTTAVADGMATTLVWTAVSAFLALADAVSAGDVTAPEAESLAASIAASLSSASSPPAPVPKAPARR